MGRSYSLDLRERVVAAFKDGDKTDEEVAELFQVGEATVHRWKRLLRETGSLVPRPPRGGGMPRRVSAEHEAAFVAIVRGQPDLNLMEIAAEFHRQSGRSMSDSAASRTLRKLGITRKKRP
jgi:transposase